MSLREPWRTRLLFLSFAVNLVAVPMAASRYFWHPPVGLPPGPPGAEFIIKRMASRLGPEDARQLRSAMEPHVEQIQVERVHMEAARRQMQLVLSQKDFDRDAATAAMTKWQASWAVWSKALGEALIDGFSRVSLEGRKELSKDHEHRP